MIKGPGSSSTVDETDTPLVLGKEKTGISSPTLSRGANGLGGLPVSLAVAIEVSFSLLYYPPPRHAPVARQFDFVISTASIGGSIGAEPHLAVPNRRPAPFILNSPSNRPASEPASGMSIELYLRNELPPPRQLMAYPDSAICQASSSPPCPLPKIRISNRSG